MGAMSARVRHSRTSRKSRAARALAFARCGAILALVTTCARGASADTAAPASSPEANARNAQRAFDEAKDLILRGQWAEACPKLEASHRFEARHTTLYRLAECYEHTSRPASAWSSYRAAATAASAGGEARRAEVATARAKQIEPSLSYLIVAVKDPPTGLTIETDGAPMAPSAWNGKVPVDPGEHTVTARAPWKAPTIIKVDVPPDRSTVVVTVPHLEDDRPAAREIGPTTGLLEQRIGRADTPPPVDVRPPPSSGSSPLRPWGLTMVGVGVATAAVGAVLFVTAEDGGGQTSCAGTCLPGAIMMGAGAVVLAVGAALFIASYGGSSDGSKTSRVSPLVVRF